MADRDFSNVGENANDEQDKAAKEVYSRITAEIDKLRVFGVHVGQQHIDKRFASVLKEMETALSSVSKNAANIMNYLVKGGVIKGPQKPITKGVTGIAAMPLKGGDKE